MPSANSLDTDQDLHGHVDVFLFFAYQVIFHSFKLSADFSPPEKFVFEKKIRNTLRGSSVLDPDQVLHFVGPDLGSNVLQMTTRAKCSVVEKVISESL